MHALRTLAKDHGLLRMEHRDLARVMQPDPLHPRPPRCRRQRRTAPHACQADTEAGGCHLTTAAGPEFYVLHPMWQGEHHANFVDPGQGMEPAQGEGRGQNAVEDAHVPAVLSAACTEGSAIETRCKRRRLNSEPEVQRHLDRGQQVGISLMGQSGHDAQAQSDAEEIRSLLERIAHLGQQPGVIHKFSALRPVKQDTLPQDDATAIPWRLDLSLRSPEASELFQLLQKLAGNGVTQLILLRVRGANLQRSPLANAIAQRLRRS